MLPNKLTSGQQFKKATVSKVNEIIDYLKTQRIVSDKTIRVNQLNSGISLSADIPTSKAGGSSTPFKHPFQLYFSTDENDVQVLCMRRGRITFSGDSAYRTYFNYEQNEDNLPSFLPLPQQDGVYDVIGYMIYDDLADSKYLKWKNGVVFSTSTNNLNFCSSYGFISFIIGQIKVETKDEKLVYSITKQHLTSGFSVSDEGLNRYFQARLSLTTYPEDGDVVQNFFPTKIFIKQGKILSDNEVIDVTSINETIDTSTTSNYYVIFDSVNKVAGIQKISEGSFVFYDDETQMYQIPLCKVSVDSITGVKVEQFFDGILNFNIDTGKVKINEEDTLDYLSQKIKIDETLNTFIDFDSTSSNSLSLKMKLEGTGYLKYDDGEFTLAEGTSSSSSSSTSTYTDESGYLQTYVTYVENSGVKTYYCNIKDYMYVTLGGGSSSYAGYCYVNNKYKNINNYSGILANGWNYYYLKVTYSTSGTVGATIVTSSTALQPSNVLTEAYVLISRILFYSSLEKYYIFQENNSIIRVELGTSFYHGSFLAIQQDTYVKIINGLSPTSTYCGYTDLKGNISTISFLLNDCLGKKIYLIGTSDGTTYTVTIYLEGNEPSATYKSDKFLLATVSADGTITQNWTSGDIYFYAQYFI